MSLPIEFHELVDIDLAEAWDWYEGLEAGLGDRFLDAVEATVTRASQWPNTGTPALRDANGEIIERKTPTNGFPYAIRYRSMDDRLLVMAVVHQSRMPDFGADRNP